MIFDEFTLRSNLETMTFELEYDGKKYPVINGKIPGLTPVENHMAKSMSNLEFTAYRFGNKTVQLAYRHDTQCVEIFKVLNID